MSQSKEQSVKDRVKKIADQQGQTFFYSKKSIRFAALGILLVVGYFQYVDSYQFPKWKVFLSGMIMGVPFSLGIFLSTLPFGRRFKVFTSILILFSALVRSLLLVPPPASIFIFVIELYAVWNILSRGRV
jgi:hypothetical protein